MSVLKSFASFSLGTWIGAGLSIITTPVITWLIKPEEFGKSSMFILAYSLLVNLLSLSTDQGFSRFYIEKTEEERPKLLATSLITSIFGILCIEFFKYKISVILFSSNNYINVIRLLEVGIISGICYRFTSMNLRMSSSGLRYSYIQIIVAISNFLITLFIAFFISKTFYAIIAAFVLSQIIGIFFTVAFNTKFWFDIIKSFRYIKYESIKPILFYSIPFIPTFIVDWVFQGVDRSFLRLYSNFNEIGLYATATKISYSLNIIQSGFATFWLPFSYNLYEKDPENTAVYKQFFNLLSFAFGLIILLLISSQKIIAKILAKEYHDVIYVFPFLLFIPFLYTLSEITVVGVNFKKKTQNHFYIIVVSTIVNLFFAYFLIRKWGAMGAAISMFIGYLVFFAMRTYIAGKLYKLNVDIKKWVIGISLILLAVSASSFLKDILEIRIICFVSTIFFFLNYKMEGIFIFSYFKKIK